MTQKKKPLTYDETMKALLEYTEKAPTSQEWIDGLYCLIIHANTPRKDFEERRNK